MTIAEALAAVRARIDRAAVNAGRDPASVRLVAVSKTKPIEAIREAYACGQRDFGENYAQELAEKAAALTDLPLIRWHFIGHLQSNKAKLVAPVAHLVHAVDSTSLVRELAKRFLPQEHRPKLPVLVEVNVSEEAAKHGASIADLPRVLEAIEAEPRLELRGLMTMPPHDLEQARHAFETLARLRHEHGGAARLAELSMGMSEDLEVAVACGATLVRVGSAIFGAR